MNNRDFEAGRAERGRRVFDADRIVGGEGQDTVELLRDMMLFIEFNTIVVRDKIPVEAAHREFLKIDEYRQRISPDIPGSDHNNSGSLGGW